MRWSAFVSAAGRCPSAEPCARSLALWSTLGVVYAGDRCLWAGRKGDKVACERGEAGDGRDLGLDVRAGGLTTSGRVGR
jgi:hypothetical protein